jgi:glycerol-3-phosphate acyltransferase PlsX
MRIALDAMGGDHGPTPNVGGARLALDANPDLTVVFVGDEAQLAPLLMAGNLPAGRVEIIHASQVVEMKEKPAEAVRRKPDASIFRSWQLMAEGAVDGLVSAGNTGAVVAGEDAEVPQMRPPARHRDRYAHREGPLRHHGRRRKRLPQAAAPP